MVSMLFSDPLGEPRETVVTTWRDYPEWHRGRARYGVWIVPVTDPALLDYVRQARKSLADVLHPTLHRQPHLTVFVCGFHGAGPRDDDFPEQRLAQQLALLTRDAGLPCTLPLSRPDSFATAAFIPVGDPQCRLRQWRGLLQQASAEIRQSDYVPHITLGLYRQCVPADELRERLVAMPSPGVSLRVEELRYVTYDAREQLGRLTDVHRLWLAEHQ